MLFNTMCCHSHLYNYHYKKLSYSPFSKWALVKFIIVLAGSWETKYSFLYQGHYWERKCYAHIQCVPYSTDPNAQHAQFWTVNRQIYVFKRFEWWILIKPRGLKLVHASFHPLQKSKQILRSRIQIIYFLEMFFLSSQLSYKLMTLTVFSDCRKDAQF